MKFKLFPVPLADARRCAWAVALLAWLLVGGCASPLPAPRQAPSHALTNTGDTRLGRVLSPQVQAHPGLSGFHVFDEPLDAFAARVLLAGAADRSIDAQYFIWHDDTVGTLLWQALWAAAERGVRVRLLLDDANTYGRDPLLAALDAHPNIELRLYNPFVYRGSRALGYASDFARLNRRMHNKSFTADNQASMVGGRNIADEYFGAAGELGFADLDVMAVGPIVAEISRSFDLYWNSASAYPAAAFVGTGGAAADAALKARLTAVAADAHAVRYVEAVRASAFVDRMLSGRIDLDWTTGQLLYDDPAKTLDGSERNDLLLLPVLKSRMGDPQRSLDIVSPYFVPGPEGTEVLAALATGGVRVRVLTNSLASSDESVVHAGYMKRRHDLLRAGVELYEMKPGAAEGSLRVRGRIGPAKVSGLHAKVFAVDGERVFLGSFNMDMRSVRLNTEMGIVIDNPAFARELGQVFDEGVYEGIYQVVLAPDGQNLRWLERGAAGALKVYDVEPETTVWKRLQVGFLAGLPIDWLL